MFKRTLYAMAVAASVAIAQPPAPRPVHMAAPAPCQPPVNHQMVRAELTIVRLHPETLKALEVWNESSDQAQKCFLSTCQVRKVLEQIKADERSEILGSPQMVMLDSQTGSVSVGMADATQFDVNLTPRVSLDRRFIQLALATELRDRTAARESFKCCSEGNESDVQRSMVVVRQMKSVVCVPTGNAVMMEVGRPNSTMKCEFSLGNFFQAEVAATNERHVCVIVMPTELNSTVYAQPMPAAQPECVGPCQVFMPAPVMIPVPPMPMCDLAMPGCGATQYGVAFVPAQEQTERAVPRTSNRTLEKLLDKYDDACANGDTEKARKLARRCLDIDPMCFSRDR